MAHDGSYEVEWKGQAFPYLMHHPNFHQTENYGSKATAGHGHSAARHEAKASAASRDGESVFEAGTGTWNGPAPRGSLSKGQQHVPQAAPTVNEPSTVRLNNGAAMPVVCLGTNAVTSPSTIQEALEVGYRGFDCAEVYGNEDVVGAGIKSFVASGKREELFLISKLWNNHHRPADVRPALEASLQALGVAYVDLYMMHWPHAWVAATDGIPDEPEVDAAVTMEETWAAMEALVDAGLVKALGVSNFSLAQVEQLLGSCRIKPAVNQIELHALNAQRKLVGVMFRKGVVSQAHSPLGTPSSDAQAELLAHPTVAKVAAECGKSPAQVVLKWNMQRGVAVVPKASSGAHLRENLEGMTTWKLSNEHKALLDTLDCGKRFLNFKWHTWAPAEEGGATKPSTIVL